jgi:UDP-N-acetylglucosamine acyltransferase
VEIGRDATIREFVAINKPVTGTVTRVGQGGYLMARTQVDHDCVLEPFVKTATGVTLGGGVHVEESAYLGMNVVVHQGLRIGRACMIGMNGVVTAHVPPFTTLINRRVTRVNTIGLRRLGAAEADISRIEAYYRGHDRDANLDDPWSETIRGFFARVAPAATARIALTPCNDTSTDQHDRSG